MPKKIYIESVVFLYILLFAYTAIQKFLVIDSLEISLASFPVIGAFPVFFAWIVPLVEMVIVGLLMIPRTKLLGVQLATYLMGVFTLFIIYMFVTQSHMPCTCGGMIETLTWGQHLYFNIFFVLIGFIAIQLTKKRVKNNLPINKTGL